mmetsp:Transcript_21754/g.37084  ORF Transcript_21754/g.37084 Transcript_21754/m.37084 type:complete len:116 (+) Transcript_21754:43-390(+)
MATNEEILFAGKPNCCGACGAWCKNTKWLITTTYVEREMGVCCPRIDNLQLIRVKDIQYKQTCCCGCCGSIHLQSTDQTTPDLYISGLPDARNVYGRLRDAVTAVHSNAKLEIDA